ncbi:hypothetical protein DINM_005157 [Dirofilaria immitis]|nr:hypothetical protein [Dirofilaria immitis]
MNDLYNEELPKRTPEIRRLRAQCAATAAVHNSNPTVSLKPAEVASQLSTSTAGTGRDAIQKEQKQLVEGTIESGKEEELEREIKPEKNDGSIEILAAKRPKRQIKAPQRFIFDDEEKEEEKRKKRCQAREQKLLREQFKNRRQTKGNIAARQWSQTKT